MKIIIITSPNVTVTKNNFDVLKEASSKDYTTISVSCLKEALAVGEKRDLYISSSASEISRLVFKGRRNILFWVQGILPEESSMRHNNPIRFLLLSQIEKFALSHSKFLAFVSEPLREHYEQKYKINFKNRYYIFPCYNTSICSNAFCVKNKYINNYFVYAGGLAVWQCFEKTLDIYKKIEDWGLPNTKLIVLTKNQKQAKEMIESRGIKNYKTGFTTPEELPNILKDAKFGFVIREDSPVNRVATPTKISTYLSCGLIPIFGISVETFRRLSEKMDYIVCWDDSDTAYERIRQYMIAEIDAQMVLKEYTDFFDSNYSRERHTEALRTIIKQMTLE